MNNFVSGWFTTAYSVPLAGFKIAFDDLRGQIFKAVKLSKTLAEYPFSAYFCIEKNAP